MGTDLTVANAARVSFGKQSEMDTSDVWGPPKLKDKDAKLIRYLAKHKHISPFGHCLERAGLRRGAPGEAQIAGHATGFYGFRLIARAGPISLRLLPIRR